MIIICKDMNVQQVECLNHLVCFWTMFNYAIPPLLPIEWRLYWFFLHKSVTSENQQQVLLSFRVSEKKSPELPYTCSCHLLLQWHLHLKHWRIIQNVLIQKDFSRSVGQSVIIAIHSSKSFLSQSLQENQNYSSRIF